MGIELKVKSSLCASDNFAKQRGYWLADKLLALSAKWCTTSGVKPDFCYPFSIFCIFLIYQPDGILENIYIYIYIYISIGLSTSVSQWKSRKN